MLNISRFLILLVVSVFILQNSQLQQEAKHVLIKVIFCCVFILYNIIVIDQSQILPSDIFF